MDHVEEYIKWLRANMKEKQLENGPIEITTPFLDRNNDYTQIYIESEVGAYRITDGGYIINDLAISGIDVLKKGRRRALLDSVLRRIGLSLDEKTCEIYTRERNHGELPAAYHRLLQGMLDVSDMFYLGNANVASIFAEEVAQFFKEHRIYSTKGITYRGKSGYEHTYDYLFQQNKDHPGRLMRLMNQPKKENFERFAFAWGDIKETLVDNGDVGQCLILINDNDQKKDTVISMAQRFQAYDMHAILWSERKKNLQMFA